LAEEKELEEALQRAQNVDPGLFLSCKRLVIPPENSICSFVVFLESNSRLNFSIIFRILGTILSLLALMMGLCFLGTWIMSIHSGEGEGMKSIGYSILITGAFGGLLFYLGRKSSPEQILRKEAIATVALGWIVASFFGCLPYVLGEAHFSLPRAFFESMSAFTTTGATVFTDLNDTPSGILLWRSLSQWLGGLGILALVVALLSILGVGGKHLFGVETSMNLSGSPMARAQDLTVRLWIVYCGLTIVCWLGLWIIGSRAPIPATGFEAFLYALTTVSTGGFAPHNASAGHFNSAAVEIFLCIFMFISSLNMILVTYTFFGNFQSKAGRTEAIGFAVMILAAWFTITLDLWLNHESEGWAALRESLFPVVSLASSTGFAAGDYDQWPLFARTVLFFLMVVGGCSGSTAGGVKVARLVILLKVISQEIAKTFRPKLVSSVKIDGKAISTEGQLAVLTYLALTAGIILFSTSLISMFEPGIDDLNSAFGAVLATFFNMGPGFGSLGPTDNFAHLHQVTLVYLSLLMLLGRLEIFVVLTLFSKHLWAKY
tara:strand:+ start:2910 stop:4547 length:1638 start_codon:yes stop_codon:yes gene_type:complete